MKTYNAEELKIIAKDVFGRYPKANKVSVTVDGMAFITDENEIAVLNHSKKNRYGKELEIFKFNREEVITSGEDNSTQITAKVLIEKINTSIVIADVEKIKSEEAAGANRKSVIDAATKRLEALKK